MTSRLDMIRSQHRKFRTIYQAFIITSTSQIKKLGTERPGGLPKVTQPVSDRLGTWLVSEKQPTSVLYMTRNAGRNGSYLLWLKLGGIVVDIKDFHHGHRCGGRALSIHVCGLDGQCVLGDFLGEKEHRRSPL